MKFSNLCNTFYKILIKIMLFLWGVITFTTIFNIYNNYSYKMSAIVIIVGCIITLLSITGIYRYLKRFDDRTIKKIALSLFIVILMTMLFWGLNYQVIPTYDLSHIIIKVNELLSSKTLNFGSSPYFSIYPTQIPLTIFLYGIESFGQIIGMANPANMVIIYNAFMTSFSFYMIYKILNKLFNSRLALIGMFLLALYPDFYLFISYYYTDIISLPFSIIGYYLLTKFDNSKKNIRYSYLFLAGIIFGIGTRLRVVVLILLIAYVLVYITKNHFKDFLKTFITIFLAFSLFWLTYSQCIYPKFKVVIDENLRVPSIHWVMMGLNTEIDGGYTDKDALYSIFSNNKTKDIMKKISKRITEVDFHFYFQKLSRVWSTGDHDILRKYDILSKYDGVHNLMVGKKQIFIRYTSQILKASIYLLFFMMLCSELNKKVKIQNSKNAILVVAMFGAIVFYLIWEALNRYSFSFLPWILMGAVPSIALLDNLLQIEKISVEKHIIDCQKYKKHFYKLIIVVVNVLLLFTGIKYAILKTNQEDFRIYQYSNTKHFISVIDEEIKEVFEVNNSFNKIQLQIKNDTIDKPCNYIYEIYDMNDNLLYKGVKEITKGEYSKTDNPFSIRNLNLKFPTIKVNGSKKFYLKFYSQEATESSYISVNTFVLEEKLLNYEYNSPEGLGGKYDINPYGETYVDNVLLDGSLRIKVSLAYKAPILKVYQFIILVIVIEIITIISLKYTLLGNNKKRK